MNNEENPKLNMFLKLSVIIGIILISVSAFYYFVIRPQNEQAQLNKIFEEGKNQVAEIIDEELRVKDLKRIEDMKNTGMSLELYYDEYSEYPDFAIQGAEQYSDSEAMVISINPIPVLDGICANYIEYTYTPINNRQDYKIDFCLEKGFGEYEAGIYKMTNMGIEAVK